MVMQNNISPHEDTVPVRKQKEGQPSGYMKEKRDSQQQLVQKWWQSENVAQSQAFDEAKKNLCSILYNHGKTDKGWKLNELYDHLQYRTGGAFDFQTMGFLTFKDFLFHCDDLYDLAFDGDSYYFFLSGQYAEKKAIDSGRAKALSIFYPESKKNLKQVPSEYLVTFNIDTWFKQLFNAKNRKPIPLQPLDSVSQLEENASPRPLQVPQVLPVEMEQVTKVTNIVQSAEKVQGNCNGKEQSVQIKPAATVFFDKEKLRNPSSRVRVGIRGGGEGELRKEKTTIFTPPPSSSTSPKFHEAPGTMEDKKVPPLIQRIVDKDVMVSQKPISIPPKVPQRKVMMTASKQPESARIRRMKTKT